MHVDNAYNIDNQNREIILSVFLCKKMLFKIRLNKNYILHLLYLIQQLTINILIYGSSTRKNQGKT